MTKTFKPSVVLATVNAPYSTSLDDKMLALCLQNPDLAKSKPGHLSSFFGEVSPSLQLEFARSHDIGPAELAAAALAFAEFSGESYPLAVREAA